MVVDGKKSLLTTPGLNEPPLREKSFWLGVRDPPTFAKGICCIFCSELFYIVGPPFIVKTACRALRLTVSEDVALEKLPPYPETPPSVMATQIEPLNRILP